MCPGTDKIKAPKVDMNTAVDSPAREDSIVDDEELERRAEADRLRMKNNAELQRLAQEVEEERKQADARRPQHEPNAAGAAVELDVDPALVASNQEDAARAHAVVAVPPPRDDPTLEDAKIDAAGAKADTLAGERLKRLPEGDRKAATLVGGGKTAQRIEEYEQRGRLKVAYIAKQLDVPAEVAAQAPPAEQVMAAYQHDRAARAAERQKLEEAAERKRAQSERPPVPSERPEDLPQPTDAPMADPPGIPLDTTVVIPRIQWWMVALGIIVLVSGIAGILVFRGETEVLNEQVNPSPVATAVSQAASATSELTSVAPSIPSASSLPTSTEPDPTPPPKAAPAPKPPRPAKSALPEFPD